MTIPHFGLLDASNAAERTAALPGTCPEWATRRMSLPASYVRHRSALARKQGSWAEAQNTPPGVPRAARGPERTVRSLWAA